MPETLEHNPEDYHIRLRPGLNADNSWDGTVSIDILWDSTNPLPVDDFHQMMHLTHLVCSSVPVMESEEEVAHLLGEYADMLYNSKSEEVSDPPAKVVGTDGNVIKVNFNTSLEVPDG